jgi:type IV secretion system protein TrbJ
MIKILFILFGFIFFIPHTYAITAIVYDPVVASNVVAQTAKVVDEINILNLQLISINKTLQQLKNSQYQWSNVQNIIQNLGKTIQQANGIAYNASNLDQQFKKYFPGFQSVTNYTQFYQDLVKKTQDTFNGVLQAEGNIANVLANEQSRLNFLQKQMQSAQGQTQAIQAAAQFASEQISQLQLLRQAVVTQTNAQTIYYAEQVQQQATTRAQESQIINAGSTTAPEIGHSGQKLHI